MIEQEINSVLQQFDPISLQEMSAVKLMNRVDTKYIIPVAMLPQILMEANEFYYCQDINGTRAAKYDTIYFDTDNLRMYTMHHNRKKTRVKIRKRSYVESDLSFLEIKMKNNKGRTQKIRIKTDFAPELYAEEDIPFVEKNTVYNSKELTPQVEILFNRITIVNKEMTERLTIDFDLRFENLQLKEKNNIPEMCIVEIKQNGYCFSHFKQLLKQHGLYRQNMSKYCLGTVLTNPYIKYNFFKRKLFYISKTVNAIIEMNNPNLNRITPNV